MTNTQDKPAQHIIKTQFGFTEGFYFGCGFFLAGAIFTTVVVPLTVVAVVFLAGLIGVNL